MTISVARFLDVANGLQPNQFSVGSHDQIVLARRSRPDLQAAAGRAGDGGVRGAGEGRPPEPDADVVRLRRLDRPGERRLSPEEGPVDPGESAAHGPAHEPGESLPLGQYQVHGEARGVGGRPPGGRACHRPGRQDLDQVHEAAPAVRPARPLAQRAARAVRVLPSTRSPPSASPDRRAACARRWSAGRSAGFTAALLLADLGVEVDVYERSPAELVERGAGIGFLPESARYLVERAGVALDRISVATSHIRYLDRRGEVVYDGRHSYRFSSWNTVYRELLARIQPSRYHLGHEMTGWADDGDAVEVRLAGRPAQRVDLLVCADGVGSIARARLLPSGAAVVRGVRGVARHGGRGGPRRGDPRDVRRRHHLLRVREQSHPRVPDTGAGWVGGAG